MQKLTIALSLALCASAGMAQAGVKVSADGRTVSFESAAGDGDIDFANAKPIPQSNAAKAPPTQLEMLVEGQKLAAAGPAGFASGGAGDGRKSPTTLPFNRHLESGDGVSSQEFGASGQPYTTSRAPSASIDPYPRAGKLFFKDGTSSFVCSASLIKRGIIVTAAHCVSKFGQRRFYTNFVYVPAYTNGSAPFGTWTGASARVMTSYYNGTDSCAQSGVICQNDIAVLRAVPQSNNYPGTRTGWFGYGWNGYSFSSGQALITQLGYPVALDGGGLMEETNSQGATTSSLSNNTVIGSLQTGGSSGGPWLVNFGRAPTLASGTGFGQAANHNIVVGTTSWGYTDTSSSGRKQQGASPFTSNNIVVLVNAACNATPAACQ